jgi:hypothetical protein
VTSINVFGSVSVNVYLYDRTAKKMTLVSRSFRPPFGSGNAGAGDLALSAGGGFLLFSASASNLVPGDFNSFASDVFLYSPAP